MARTKQTARIRQPLAQRKAAIGRGVTVTSVGPPPKPEQDVGKKSREMRRRTRFEGSDSDESSGDKRKLLDPEPVKPEEEEEQELGSEGDVAAQGKAPEQTLLEFLAKLSLEICVEKVQEAGVTSVSDLKDLEEVDLVELASLAKMNLLQRRQFIRAVADAKKSSQKFPFDAVLKDKDLSSGLKTSESDSDGSESDLGGFNLFGPVKPKKLKSPKGSKSINSAKRKRGTAAKKAKKPPSPSEDISVGKLKKLAKRATDITPSESDAETEETSTKKKSSSKNDIIVWDARADDDSPEPTTSGFGGQNFMFGRRDRRDRGDRGRGRGGTQSHEDLQEEMLGNRAHVCCSCARSHDALEVFVNNKKFSDVTFLVGSKPKADLEEDEMKNPAAAPGGSPKEKNENDGDGGSGSLDDDDAQDEEKKGSSLCDSMSERQALVYAMRGLLAAASPVFRALLSGTMLEACDEDAVIPVPDCTPRGFITMLHFMYTGREEIVDASNLVETMYIADKYQLDRLMYVCSEYIRHNLSIQNVCGFLLDSGVWVSAGLMKFVSLHGEDILQSPDFVKLSRTKIMNIIASDALAVHDEMQVFEAVVAWGRAALKRKRLEATIENLREEVDDVLALVRFPQMSLDDLLNDVAATGLLDERELFSIVMYWQTQGQTKNEHFRFNCKRRLHRFIELTYESDWDENGVIFWIGSQGGTESFQNPTPTRGMTCSMSSTEQGTPDMLTSRTPAQLYTSNVQNSTIALDLGDDHLLTPNHYTIRHGFQSANYYPRNWLFEGSADGQAWECLRTHTTDTTINSIQGTGSFAIDITEVESKQDAEPKYRHFRMKNTGPDHSNSNYLMICGIEIYGQLYTKAKHGRHFSSRGKRGTREHQFPRSGFTKQKERMGRKK